MSERQFIDSLDFANNKRELRGQVALVEMPRLQDVLASPDASLQQDSNEGIGYILRGLQDESGKLMLSIKLDGVLELRCQRCLGGLVYPLKLVSQLFLAHRDDWDESYIEDGEAETILADQRLDVFALFEEEILLGLPFAPRHPAGACQVVAGGYLAEEGGRMQENPFAILSELKK